MQALPINVLTILKQALLHSIDKKTGRRSKRAPQYVKKGQKFIARFETSGPICIESFDDYPQLGRFTLRDEGKLRKVRFIVFFFAD
jgi:peptide chain release factor subunit 3